MQQETTATQVDKLKKKLRDWKERNRNATTRLEQLVYEIGREAILEELSRVSKQFSKFF